MYNTSAFWPMRQYAFEFQIGCGSIFFIINHLPALPAVEAISMSLTSRFTEFRSGAQAELPILIGVAPFGMIYGVLALQAGIPPIQAQAMSAVVFGGSSQIILTQLVSIGAPSVVMVLTVAVVNLRHALYGASVAPYIQHLRLRWKLLLSYLLTDEAYVVTILHYEQTEAARKESLAAPGSAEITAELAALDPQETPDPAVDPDFGPEVDQRHWYYLGAGLALWTCWQLSTALGIFLGAAVPASWGLEFTLPLTFIALVVPNLNSRATVAAALTAGLAAVLVYSTPYKLGLIVAALTGVLVGLVFDKKEVTQ
jgi:predicted branched-subunit amino acid permease